MAANIMLVLGALPFFELEQILTIMNNKITLKTR